MKQTTTMKQHILITFIGIAIVFSACKSTQKVASTNQINMETSSIVGKKWQLIELRGNPVAATINDKVPFIEFSDTGKRYSASAGCNGLGGAYTLSGNGRIKFSLGMSTVMACDNMEVETELKKILGLADNFTITGNVLSLNKARMAPLARFKVIEENATTQLNGTWELDYISGAKIAFEGLFPDKKPTITFNLPETGASGNGSCNNYRTTFTIDGNNIKFNEPASTRMACPGNGEATFFETLKKVSKYSVNGTTLNMIMGDIAIMRFQKK